MSVRVTQVICQSFACPEAYSGWQQRNIKFPHHWIFVSGIHLWPVDPSSHNGPTLWNVYPAIVSSHYNDVIVGTMASQIPSLTIVYSAVYSGADQRKHQSSASLAFVRGIHRSPVNSPHKWPVTRKMFPFDDVIMVLERPVTHIMNKDSRALSNGQISFGMNAFNIRSIFFFIIKFLLSASYIETLQIRYAEILLPHFIFTSVYRSSVWK